jgi:hypothetical protein
MISADLISAFGLINRRRARRAGTGRATGHCSLRQMMTPSDQTLKLSSLPKSDWSSLSSLLS